MDRQEAFLDDGTRILFRPIEPEDKDRLQEGLANLSESTRYLRFFGPIDHFTERQLRYLTEIDYQNHYAWIALLPDEPGSPGVGVARWIRLSDGEELAEGAVVVADDLQGKGIGKTLLWLAARTAIERGVRAFQVWTIGDNNKVHALLEELGAQPAGTDSGVQEYRIPLPSTPEELDGTPAPLVLRAVAEGRLASNLDNAKRQGIRLD